MKCVMGYEDLARLHMVAVRSGHREITRLAVIALRCGEGSSAWGVCERLISRAGSWVRPRTALTPPSGPAS